MLPVVNNRNYLSGLFNDFFGDNWMRERFSDEFSNSVPAVNIIEEKDAFKIEVAAPGLNKKDFKIDVHNNLLTISAETKHEVEDTQKNYVRREFSYSTFKRSFSLPETVESDKIKATQSEGILTISIPKKPDSVEKGPRQISIS
jgi:HSP20 family protein